MSDREQIESYINAIDFYKWQYTRERQCDLYKIDQSRWNRVLLYIHDNVFKVKGTKLHNEKSNIDYSDSVLICSICDKYINDCYEYSKEISVLGFCKLTGIHPDTIYSWGNGKSRLSSGHSDTYKKLRTEREESLSCKLLSGKENKIAILGMINHYYGWNIGNLKVMNQKKDMPDVASIAEKYGIDLERKN